MQGKKPVDRREGTQERAEREGGNENKSNVTYVKMLNKIYCFVLIFVINN